MLMNVNEANEREHSREPLFLYSNLIRKESKKSMLKFNFLFHKIYSCVEV